MYKMLHFGDTHLGRKHPSKISEKRVESGLKSLEHCVQAAIDEDVDFAVHAGDVFDKVYPWHSVVTKAQEILKPLEENQIPLYIIRGNHDRRYGKGREMKGVAIQHLTSDNIQLIDPSPGEFPSKISYNNEVHIYGLGYHSNRTPNIIKGFEPDSQGFNILLLHDFVKGVTRTYSDSAARAEQISSENLDYVGIGHDHQPNPQREINGTTFAATGSTIDYDFNASQLSKTYNIVEFSPGNGVENVENKAVEQSLELKKIQISLENADKQQIQSKVEDAVPEQSEAAVKINISGTVTQDQSKNVATDKIAEHIENNVEGVVLVEIMLNLGTSTEKTSQSNQENNFSMEEYLEENTGLDEDLRNKILEMHDQTKHMLANEENLTSSGLNLRKDSKRELRQLLKQKIIE